MIYKVWNADGQSEEDARTFDVGSADMAAEYWAAYYDANGNYSLSNGGTVTVCVKAAGDDDPQAFLVDAEMSVSYTAREIT